MADQQLTKLLVELEARTARFEKNMTKASKLIRRTERRSAALNKTMGRLGKTLAATFSVAVISRAARAMGDMASEMVHAADTIGISVESLQAWRAAAQDVGIAAGTTDVALRRFTRRLGEAASTGKGELAPILERLNIAIREQDGSLRSTEDVLADYADAIQGAGDQSERLALVFKGFDSEGAPLVQILAKGSEGLREMRDAAIETGRVLEGDLARRLETISTQVDAQIQRIKIWGTTWAAAAAEAVGLGGKRTATVEYFAELNREIASLTETIENQPALEAFVENAVGFGPRAAAMERLGVAIQERDRVISELITKIDKPLPAADPAPVIEKAATAIADTYIPAVEEATAATEDFIDSATTGFSQLAEAQQRVTTGVADELAVALVKGEADFRRFAQSLLTDLTRIITRQLLMKSLVGLFGGTSFGSALGIAAPAAAGGGAAAASVPIPTAGSGRSVAGSGVSAFAPSVVVNMNAPQADPDAAGKAIGGEVRRQLKAAWLIEARNQQRPGGALNPVTGGPV